MKKAFIILTSLFLLNSCASFNNSYTENNIIALNSSNLKALEGNYKMFASREYEENGSSTLIKDSKNKKGLYQIMTADIPNIKNIGDLEKAANQYGINDDYTWDKDDYTELKVDHNTLTFNFIKDGKAVKSYVVKGKLKGGYYYLPKQNNCVKLPMVIDACIKNERRLGLTKDNGLLVHEYNKTSTTNAKLTAAVKFLGNYNDDAVYSYDKLK